MSAYLPVNDSVISQRRVGLRAIPKGVLWGGLFGLSLLPALSLLPTFRGGECPPPAPFPSIATASAVKIAPRLAVQQTRIEREYECITVQGEVVNLSPEPLKDVEAVVEFFDSPVDFAR